MRQQIRQAGFHLPGGRFAIAHRLAGRVRTALQNVGDINCVPGEAHGLDDLCQELTGLADEGFALQILVLAGRFTDRRESLAADYF